MKTHPSLHLPKARENFFSTRSKTDRHGCKCAYMKERSGLLSAYWQSFTKCQFQPSTNICGLQGIYNEGELDPAATIRKFLIVQPEGARQVRHMVDHYSLSASLAVGYRVRSLRTHTMAQDRAESEQWNPEGVRAISRGLSVATPPDGRPNRISTPEGSQSFRHDQRNHQPKSGIHLVFVRLSRLLCRLLRPLRGRGYIFTLSGGVATPNPRLMAGNPPGCNTLASVHFRITANTAGGESKNTRKFHRVEGLRLEDW